ncbi:MAG: Muconolactone delta-isomerase [Acidimicrobiaceae bacterium]
MLFLVTGRLTGVADPTPEFLHASKDTLEALGAMQKAGKLKAGGVFIGPLGVCFIVDAESNDDLHLTLTTLPSFRFAEWEVMPLIPFHRDIEMSLDDALARATANQA